MKKILIWIAVIIVFGSLVTVDYINFKAIAELKKQNQILQQNGGQLITVNTYLSENLGKFSDVIKAKSEWDKEVAAKIRELDSNVEKFQTWRNYMETQIKSFQKQFSDCKEAGLTKTGEVMKFRDHPELLPAPWHRKAVENVQKLLKEDTDAGLTPIECGRFGGQCNSKHSECRKLRNLTGN